MIPRKICLLAQRTALKTRVPGRTYQICSRHYWPISPTSKFHLFSRQLSTVSNLQLLSIATPSVPHPLPDPKVQIPIKKPDTPVVLSNAQDTLTIQQGEENLEVPLLWLRDSCQCKNCVNEATNQRTKWTICTEAKLQEAEISEGVLHAVWTDGHESRHKLEDLRRKFHVEKNSPLVRRHTWNRQTWRGLPLPVIPQEEIFTDSGLRELLSNIHRFGFGLVKDCGPSEAETEALVRRIAPPMPTTFSQAMWTFTSNMARGDTAYSNEYLAPHTDTTYFSNPCRIQVFHCLDRTGCSGGETILTDGFQCAEELRRINSQATEALSSVAQECVYVEPDVCYKWTDTVFSHSKADKSLQRVRFNMYDRSTTPPLCPTKDVNLFYLALKQFADLTQARDNQLFLKLTPGLVIFIDNWRVLHGRTEFFGKRVLTGCYMDNDEFNHACRKSKVIQ